jgi:hypothetical protein
MLLYVSKASGTKDQQKSLRALAWTVPGTNSWFPFTPFILQPGNRWSGSVQFGKREGEDLVDEVTKISIDIQNSSLEKYLADPEKNRSLNNMYELPPETYKEVCNRLSQNVAWLKYGTYRTLLRICPSSEEKNAIFQAAYTFHLTDLMLKHLESQARGYKYVAMSGDPSVLISAKATLRKLTDAAISDTLANEAHGVDPNF